MVQLLVLTVLVVLGVAYALGYVGHRHQPAHAAATGTARAPSGLTRDATISWLTVALLPVLFVGWFVVGSLLIGDPNEPGAPEGWDAAWRVVVLWLLVLTAPAVGIVFGRRAVNRDEAGGRGAFLANAVLAVALTALTLGGGLLDAFS